MNKIGITGGIGSGKTFVCNIFQKLGTPIFNADIVSKELVTSSKEIALRIRNEFGDTVFDNNDKLIRKKLADIVFNNHQKLNVLNDIIHPEVENYFLNWSEQNSDSPYILKEAAILFESGSYINLDKIITVYSPINIRVERILSRDSAATAQTVHSIINKQMSDNDRADRSDYIIINDNNTPLLPQILKLDNIFRNEDY